MTFVVKEWLTNFEQKQIQTGDREIRGYKRTPWEIFLEFFENKKWVHTLLFQGPSYNTKFTKNVKTPTLPPWIFNYCASMSQNNWISFRFLKKIEIFWMIENTIILFYSNSIILKSFLSSNSKPMTFQIIKSWILNLR